MNTGDQRILEAITGQETSGTNAQRYAAKGQLIQDSSGNWVRALGKYQFLPGTAASNAPAWFTKQYGTNYLSQAWQSAFLSSSSAQDAAAQNYLGSLEAVAEKQDLTKHPEIWYIAEGWYGGSGSIGGADIGGQGSGAPSLYEYASQVTERWRNWLGGKVSVGGETMSVNEANANNVDKGGKETAIGDQYLLGLDVTQLSKDIEKNLLIGGILLALLAGGFTIIAASAKPAGGATIIPVPV